MSRRKPNKLVADIFKERVAQAISDLGGNRAEIVRELKDKCDFTLTAQTLIDWENGSLPVIDRLFYFAKIAGKPIGWFLGEDEPSSQTDDWPEAPEEQQLLCEVLEVIRSDTIHAGSLKMNIRSFLQAVRVEAKCEEHEERLRKIEEDLEQHSHPRVPEAEPEAV